MKPKLITQLNIELIVKIDEATTAFRQRAIDSLKYQIEHQATIPRSGDGMVAHALERGFVGAAAAVNHFGIDETVSLAHSLLEDVNAHSEAAALLAEAKKNTP